VHVKVRTIDRPFYAWAAAAAAAIAFAGFARTYYLKAWFGTPDISTLVHVHGIAMTLWVALFIAQVALVAKGRVDLHRRLGIAGAGLAALIVVLGFFTAIAGARRGVPEGAPPLIFMAITMSVVVVFAIFVAAALYFRKRSGYHKRLMVLASLTVIQPAVARVALDVLGIFNPLVFFGLTIALLTAFIGWDTVRNRRLHPAFGWGLLFFLLSLPARFLVASSGPWQDFARWLVG
jgi:hypothetical protein